VAGPTCVALNRFSSDRCILTGLVIAQSLLEYGLLAAVVTAFQGAITWVHNWVVESPDQVWLLVGGLVILGMFWVRVRK